VNPNRAVLGYSRLAIEGLMNFSKVVLAAFWNRKHAQ
jgi:hypothetical protein